MQKWDDIQINFMSNHDYHTSYCKKFNADLKSKNLERLINQQES